MFVKGNRSPVIVDVLYSLEWFLLVFSGCVPFIYARCEQPLSLCMRLLPAILLYIASALITRLIKQPVLRIALPFAAAAACVFIGRNTTECALLAVLGIFSVVCCFIIHFRMYRGSPRYNNTLLLLPVLIVMAFVLGKFDMHDAASCTYFIMAVFLPIFIAVWYINKFAVSVSIFTQRADQPIKRISRNMYKTIGTVVLIVLFITLLVPQSNGINLLFSLIETGLAGILAVIILIAELLAVPVSEDIADEFGALQAQPLDMGNDSMWDVYLLYALAAIILIFLTVSAITMLVKLLRYLFSGFMHYDGKAAPETNGSDTVEKIERHRENRSSERLGRTNAGKIRRIYKKRISSVLGDSLGRLSSYTPSEIAVLCRKKGEDISELTALYKKARYTNDCTEDDVKKAKQLQ